jgi:hypothetical protein
LNGEFYLQILVPLGIDLQLALADPLGVILNDAFDLKVIRNFVFFQSGPDCEKLMPSLRI